MTEGGWRNKCSPRGRGHGTHTKKDTPATKWESNAERPAGAQLHFSCPHTVRWALYTNTARRAAPSSGRPATSPCWTAGGTRAPQSPSPSCISTRTGDTPCKGQPPLARAPSCGRANGSPLATQHHRCGSSTRCRHGWHHSPGASRCRPPYVRSPRRRAPRLHPWHSGCAVRWRDRHRRCDGACDRHVNRHRGP